mgnify:CR=1 FL=1
MAYSDKVLDHYENPRNVGSMDKNDPNVGTGMVGAPACGDVMKLQIKVNDAGVIEDLWLRLCDCFELPGHRMAERQNAGSGTRDQELCDC